MDRKKRWGKPAIATKALMTTHEVVYWLNRLIIQGKLIIKKCDDSELWENDCIEVIALTEGGVGIVLHPHAVPNPLILEMDATAPPPPPIE